MPLRRDQAVDIVTLVLVGWMCTLGAACFALVIRFRSRIRSSSSSSSTSSLSHLKEFNSPWLLRVLLSLLGTLWVLLELLRLPIIRSRGWLLHSVSARGQRSLCRGYVVGSLGAAEPAFFLTTLLLIRDSLCEEPFSPSKRRWRSRSLLLIALLTLPCLLLQFFLVVITPKLGYSGALPRWFTDAFVMEQRRLPSSLTFELAACRIPLLSTIAMSVFSICYVLYFLYLGWKMMLLVINRRLQVRVYGLVLAIVVLIPLHLLLLGLSSSALHTRDQSKHRPVHLTIPLLRFMTVAAIVGVGEWVLVIRPISDAMSVLRKSLASMNSRSKTGRTDSWGAIPLDRFSLLLEEDRRSLITERSVELTMHDLELATPDASAQLKNNNSSNNNNTNSNDVSSRRHSQSCCEEEVATTMRPRLG